MSNFMKIWQVRAELFHADRQTYEGIDRHDHVTQLKVAFRNFWKHTHTHKTYVQEYLEIWGREDYTLFTENWIHFIAQYSC